MGAPEMGRPRSAGRALCGAPQIARPWRLAAANFVAPAQWASVVRGRAERVAGYAVEAALAVGILAKANPEAAAWWRENTPHLIAPKRYLVFHEEVCRIADI